jgi:sorbitol-specific phosphotransferase system component IIBC
MRIVLLHEQLLTTLSIMTAIVALSAGFDWWRGGQLSSRSQVIRGIWALLLVSEVVIGIVMVAGFGQTLANPLHLVYGIVALLMTASVIWVLPRFFVARQQAQSLTIAMVIVAVVLHRLALTGS